jgi:hypothetical protein
MRGYNMEIKIPLKSDNYNSYTECVEFILRRNGDNLEIELSGSEDGRRRIQVDMEDFKKAVGIL